MAERKNDISSEESIEQKFEKLTLEGVDLTLAATPELTRNYDSLTQVFRDYKMWHNNLKQLLGNYPVAVDIRSFFFESDGIPLTINSTYRFDHDGDPGQAEINAKGKELLAAIHKETRRKLEYLRRIKREDYSPNKIRLVFDADKGIYLKEESTKLYPIRGKRGSLIQGLINKKLSLKDIVELTGQTSSLVQKEIKKTNQQFRQRIGINRDLIVHLPNGGYAISEDFEFIGS